MRISKVITLAGLCGCAALASDWSAPVDVLHDLKPCVTYRARLDGDMLIVQATLQPGWHTFTIDNERRAAEKRAGKPSLGIDQPTKIKFEDGLELTGTWYQTPPRDFSKPELRWYSWGFEQQAVFTAKVRPSGPGPAKINIRGQACTDTTCKNVDVSLTLAFSGTAANASPIDLTTLVPVR